MNRKIFTAAALGATIIGAGGVAMAATGGSSPAVVVQQQNAPTGTDAPATEDPAARADDHGGKLAEVLAPLVTDGTITQAQADAVIAAIQDARPADGGRHGGPGGHHGRGMRMEALSAAAEALGMTEADLRTGLQAGKTVAQIATEQGKDVQQVIDALVAEAKTHLDQAVTDGKLTQAEADEKLADATTRITDFVNNGGPRHRGDGQVPADSAPADTAPAGGAGS